MSRTFFSLHRKRGYSSLSSANPRSVLVSHMPRAVCLAHRGVRAAPAQSATEWSTYNSASLLLRFNPTGETTKYPKLFRNLASKSQSRFVCSLTGWIDENGPRPAGEMHVRSNVCRKQTIQEETGSGCS